jgi:hypothetical protein
VEILLENNELLVPALCQTISRNFLEESDADDPKPQDTATSGFAKETQGFGAKLAEVDKLISEN